LQKGSNDSASRFDISPRSQSSASIAAPVGNPAKEPIKKAVNPPADIPRNRKNPASGSEASYFVKPNFTISLAQTEKSASDGKIECANISSADRTVSIVRSTIKRE